MCSSFLMDLFTILSSPLTTTTYSLDFCMNQSMIKTTTI